MPAGYKLGVKQMKETKIQRTVRFYDKMAELGFSYSEAQSLRRIELTLQRWGEHECNGDIERDEETGKAYSVSRAYTQGAGEYKRWPTADRETGALKRLAKIMAKHPELWAYHQSDPRGCALYIGRNADIKAAELSSNYTRGFGVCI